MTKKVQKNLKKTACRRMPLYDGTRAYIYAFLQRKQEIILFNREQLQKGFNNIEQSDPIFADLFADIDLYSNRLGTGDQKQSDTVASLIKEIDKADLLNSDAEILGNAYEYLIGQFASETGKKAGEFYTPHDVVQLIATMIEPYDGTDLSVIRAFRR